MGELLLVEDFEPFTSDWGVVCEPCICDQGLFVPVGWEEELEKRNINYELRNDLTITNEEIL
jgi:hypothetical protein